MTGGQKSPPFVMNKEAYNYCIRLLSYRDYSKHKVRQKLKDREYQPEEIDEVIEKLTEQQYLNEENYARIRIKTWALKGISPQMIAKKLKQENLFGYGDQINAIFEEYHYSEDQQIQELIEKKLRYQEIPKDPEIKYKLQTKVLRYLISKGHNYSHAKRHIDNKFYTD